MSKKAVHKKKKVNKLTVILGIIAVILALVTGGLVLITRGIGDTSDPQMNTEMTQGNEIQSQQPGDKENDSAAEDDITAGSEETEASDEKPQETKSPGESDSVGKNNNNSSENKDPADNNSSVTEPANNNNSDIPVNTQPHANVVERVDADYERWLAAAMLMGVSMEYPEFDLQGIYIASETTIEDKMESAGSYIIFTSGGETLAVHSVPLNGERSASGTRDISTETLGFATFDLVDVGSVDTASMKEIRIEDLGELIAQSLLVSIYIH